MADVNVIGAMRVVAHNCTPLAGVLMGFFHSVCVPVRPVDPVLKQRNSKYVGKRTSNGPVPILPVHVCKAKIQRKVYTQRETQVQIIQRKLYGMLFELTPKS